MTLPLVAPIDIQPLTQLARQLPHALLILAEPGLHGQQAANYLAAAHPSDLRCLTTADSSTISAEQTREFLSQLRTIATTRRVVYIPQAERLSESAQNILLKALEEPNPRTHFILVAPHHTALLETVRSRCQILTLHRTTPAQDDRLLVASGLPATEQQQLRFLAAGRPALLEQLIADPTQRHAAIAIAADAKQLMSAPHSYQSLLITQRYAADRHQAQQLLSTLHALLRFQLLHHHTTPALEQLMERLASAQESLQSNAHIRLTLLAFVV